MVTEIIYSLVVAALPLFLFTYLVLLWINRRHIKKGKAPILGDDFELDGLKDLPKDKENKLQEKWMTFGGGFYGMVGLLTYAVSEYREITDIIANFQGFNGGVIQTIISLFVQFIIQSIMNIIEAVTWPLFWMKELDGASFWVLLVAAYLGYYTAIELLNRQHQSNPSNSSD
ncbi:hypothetical protein FLL45_09385 [Aliikangiella marina]|uniref:Uncharacterized protein n=1 Tax=Aliikangiella marina TaxID=1712262 RepID=A0A545TD44_9GAMM|nr:hypothetical protein [Aliikangiella marina]TQV75140.1 hypothetical protein FLL45_09385 [Aliikangiella marina]